MVEASRLTIDKIYAMPGRGLQNMRARHPVHLVFELIGKSFRGKMKLFMVIAWVAMFAMFCFAVYSLIQFLAATEISTKLNWGVAFIVSMQFLGGMKMWYFLELNKLASARDIRRLELRMIEKAS